MKRGKSQVKYCHKFNKLTHSQTQTHWNTLHELRNAGRKECFKWNFLGPAKAPSSPPPLRLAGLLLRFFARVFHKLLCFTIYYLTINENHRFWVENTTIKTLRQRERGAFFFAMRLKLLRAEHSYGGIIAMKYVLMKKENYGKKRSEKTGAVLFAEKHNYYYP